jgi:hypothetical protein
LLGGCQHDIATCTGWGRKIMGGGRSRLTAQRRNGGIDRFDQDALAVKLMTVNIYLLYLLSLCNMPATYLFARFGVQQDPAKFNDLC